MTNAIVELVAVNVAMPGYLGERRGKMVESGIRKTPVRASVIQVAATNLEGDGQADLHNHGGFDKAIYAYPVDHLPAWTAELRPDAPYGPGSFGENLSVRGWLETAVYIGDVWQWGDAVLQVSQPRYPCYKLGMALKRPKVVKALVANRRTGWYLRVLVEGSAPVAGPVTLIERGAEKVTVLKAHQARLPGASPALVERVAAAPALARGLREQLLQKLEAVGAR